MSMLKAIVIGIFVIIAAFIVLAVYACCVVAGRADQIDEFRSKYTK
nr:hypothetical protein [Enterococcus innesii]